VILWDIRLSKSVPVGTGLQYISVKIFRLWGLSVSGHGLVGLLNVARPMLEKWQRSPAFGSTIRSAGPYWGGISANDLSSSRIASSTSDLAIFNMGERRMTLL
jgi:hypothetical protein